jgi:drug/metabolite transporter (DMT)-like permease
MLSGGFPNMAGSVRTTTVRDVATDGRNPTVGVVWAGATALSYSLSAIVGKDLLDPLGPASLLFWRFGIASAVLWSVTVVWHRRGGPDPLEVPRARSLAMGMLFGTMVYTGFVALQHLDVSVYIVVVYLYPVLVVVGSSVLGHHRASPLTWVALAVVMAGVVLTVPELFGGVGEVSTFGVALALLQAVLMAVFMIASGRVLPQSTDGVVSAAWNVLGGAVVMTPLAFAHGLVVPQGARLVGEVLLFALVPTVVANVCFFRAMRHVAPGVVAMVMTAEIALAIFWSVLFLDEHVGPIELVGAVVVMLGVLLAQWVNVRDAREVASVDDAWAATPPVP